MNSKRLKKTALYILAGLGGLALLSVLFAAPVFFFFSRSEVATPPKSLTESPVGFGSNLSSGKSGATRSGEGPTSKESGGMNLKERKIVKNGSLSLLVKKAEETATQIKKVAREAGGFVQNSNIYEVEKGVKGGVVSIRVPADKFREAMGEIKELAVEVKKEEENTRDVTERYLDIEARLENRRAEEEQYQQIMKQAEEVEDVLNVASRLSDVRGEIERLEAQLDYLEGEVDMSTITVNLTSEAEIEVLGIRWRPLYVVKKAAQDGLKSFTAYIDSMVKLIFRLPVIGLWSASILFLLVVILRILGFVWRRFVKNKHKKATKN